MSIEQVVTRQNEWEIQICDNAVGSFRTYLTFLNEEQALGIYKDIKFRLVQKAIIDVGGEV